MANDKFFGTSAAARQASVAEDTLRRYEQLGVIHPARDSSGRRIYTEADVQAAREYRARQKLPHPIGGND